MLLSPKLLNLIDYRVNPLISALFSTVFDRIGDIKMHPAAYVLCVCTKSFYDYKLQMNVKNLTLYNKISRIKFVLKLVFSLSLIALIFETSRKTFCVL